MKLRLIMMLICLLSCCLALADEAVVTRGAGAAMTEAARELLTSLNAEERAKAFMTFDDPARLDWHNIPKPERKGLQVRDMSDQQRKLCHALLRAALSDTGYDKAVKIMALESNLHEGEKNLTGGQLRDPERYFVTIFGDPDSAGTWGWSFEGHHFSLNFVIQEGEVVSDTPSFWGANPATVHLFVPGGPEVGTRTLADEEQLAFDLLHSLDGAQLEKAVIADEAPVDYRAAGEPQPPIGAPQGLSASEMTPAQQQTLRALLESYSGNLSPELAAARIVEIDVGGFDRVYFAWAGAREPGVGHSYRVQGPTFILELVNVQADPAGTPANHIHSVWRSMHGDFGVEVR